MKLKDGCAVIHFSTFENDNLDNFNQDIMRIWDKGSKAYSIFALKCPRCHETNLFETPTFSFQRPFDMHEECTHCGQDFMPEPGFYYGAMFISYIFMGWFCIGFVALFHWVLGWSINASFLALIAVCAVFFVYIFRLARSIWININVKYDPTKRASVVRGEVKRE